MADGGIRIYVDLPETSPADHPWLFSIGQQVALAALQGSSMVERRTDNPLAAGSTPAPATIAQRLHASGYFRDPELWRKVEEHGLYTQNQHKKWIERQPCLRLGGPVCGGDVVGHHVRTADNSGTGMKPLHWYLVPLCHTHHLEAHGAGAMREEKLALLETAVSMTADRMKAAMKHQLEIASLRELTQEMFDEWEEFLEGEV